MFALLVDGDLLASGMHGGDGVDGLAAFRRRAARRLGVSQHPIIICKFPQKYLFLTRGGSSLPSGPGCLAVTGVGLSFMYRAPFGANDQQSGMIYFEAAQRPRRASASA